MSFTVFLGNLPTWVTADDIKQWLSAEDLVADSVKVIRNHETQESKGFAFVEAPTNDEMQAIIRRFDRAPLEDRLLRANPAQPPKGKDGRNAAPAPTQAAGTQGTPASQPPGARAKAGAEAQRHHRRKRGGKDHDRAPRSAFANELAKVL
jgi:RNA recognition motif-containing protein